MTQQSVAYCQTVITNLNVLPPNVYLHPHELCTVGDMHGNPIKLIWLLYFLGILRFAEPKEQFAKLIELYEMDVSAVNQETIAEFKSIIASAQFHPEHTRGLILIGDLLADRGQNDYFMLRVFEVLSEKRIPYEILLSNHDVNTLIFSERPENIDKLIDLNPDFNRSLVHLVQVLDKNHSRFEDVITSLDTYFKPHLLALKLVQQPGYTFLFTHGVFDIVIYTQILKVLEIPFDVNSIDSFKDSLTILNKSLTALLIQHQYHLINNILYSFIWNRKLNQPTQHFLHTHKIHLIHGHVGEANQNPRCSAIPETLDSECHTNLDTNIGRPVMAPIQNKGIMKLFFHHEEAAQAKESTPLKSGNLS